MIDMLPRETASGETAFAPHVGGSVFNSALALGRLGVAVSFFSGLSDDLFGRMLQQALADSNVDLSRARVSARPTTLAFVTLEEGQASYFFYDENSAGRMLEEVDLPHLDADVEALLFGGISLAPEPCGATYEAFMLREHSHRVTMLDPNIRPAFIPDEEKHRARIHRMMGMADIVKISREDLDWLTGTPDAQTVEGFLSAGPSLIIVTDGGEGSVAHWNGGRIHVPAQKVEVVDTVGAGDTFNAGVLTALHERDCLNKERLENLRENEVREILSFAARVAAITVSRAGANPPWREEL